MAEQAKLNLVVGSDSTWSLRAWLCLRLAGLEPDLLLFKLSEPSAKGELAKHSPSKLVPVLRHNGLEIHDSLAIAEYANELAEGRLWPKLAGERAQARSLVAELHSGFTQIRQSLPFTLQPVSAAETEALGHELARLEQIFSQATGPFMYQQASIVDAFYAVLAYRLKHYAIELEGAAGRYQRSLIDWPLWREALQQAELWAK